MLSDKPFWKGFCKECLNSEKINFEVKSDRLTKNFPSQDIYLSSKKKTLLKFWGFISPRAPIPHSFTHCFINKSFISNRSLKLARFKKKLSNVQYRT